MMKSEEIQATFLPVVQIVLGKRSALGCRRTEAPILEHQPGSRVTLRVRARAEPKIGMVQRKRRQGNTFDGPEIVEWVQPTGGKAGSDGGLHPPDEEAVTFEHHPGVFPVFEPNPKIRRFDRASNSENGRTNLPRTGWQEIHNLFYILRFDRKHKTN